MLSADRSHSASRCSAKCRRQSICVVRSGISTTPDLTGADIEEALAQALTQPTREDDTHPSPMERFDLVRGMLASGATPDGLVWDLFANRTALAVEMTEGINTQIVSLMTPDPVSAPT